MTNLVEQKGRHFSSPGKIIAQLVPYRSTHGSTSHRSLEH